MKRRKGRKNKASAPKKTFLITIYFTNGEKKSYHIHSFAVETPFLYLELSLADSPDPRPLRAINTDLVKDFFVEDHPPPKKETKTSLVPENCPSGNCEGKLILKYPEVPNFCTCEISAGYECDTCGRLYGFTLKRLSRKEMNLFAKRFWDSQHEKTHGKKTRGERES